MPSQHVAAASTLLVNAEVLLTLGVTSVCLNRCRECGTPALGQEFGHLLVCGYCGADDQVFTEVAP